MKYKKIRVGALIIDKKSKSILLLYRYHDGEEYFCTVGGTVETGETLVDAIKREVFEEVNLRIKNPKLIFEYDHDKFLGHREVFFLIDSFEGEVKLGHPELDRLSPTNIFKPQWISIPEIPNLKLLPPPVKNWICDNLDVLK